MDVTVIDRTVNPQTSYVLTNGDVEPSSKLSNVKNILHNQCGLPPPEYQRLSYDGHPLDDNNRTLKDYGIRHQATLELQPTQVTVVTPDGKKLTVDVHPTSTISELKASVEDQEGVPVADQRLYFNGEELDDPKTILDYSIRHGSTIDLRGMQVHVHHYNGNDLTFSVTPTDTLGNLKVMIEESEGTPVEEQFLLMGPKLLRDDECTLDDYNIKHGTVLKLEQMKIFVSTETGKFPLTVRPGTTIGEVKSMIEKKTGTKPTEQGIKLKALPLKDNDATLHDCGIVHRDTIHMEVGGGGDEYKVVMGDYVSAFEYKGSPKKKKVGKRSKIKNNIAGFYSTVQSTDTEAGTWITTRKTDGS
jgi:ubiquitin C